MKHPLQICFCKTFAITTSKKCIGLRANTLIFMQKILMHLNTSSKSQKVYSLLMFPCCLQRWDLVGTMVQQIAIKVWKIALNSWHSGGCYLRRGKKLISLFLSFFFHLWLEYGYWEHPKQLQPCPNNSSFVQHNIFSTYICWTQKLCATFCLILLIGTRKSMYKSDPNKNKKKGKSLPPQWK